MDRRPNCNSKTCTVCAFYATHPRIQSAVVRAINCVLVERHERAMRKNERRAREARVA